MKRIAFIFLAGFSTAIYLCAKPVTIQLPPETGTFKQDIGAELANGQCLVCHSVEYISTQPKKDRTFWAASVKKMADKYGAQTPAEQIEPLLDYLTKNYGIVGTNAPSTNQTAQAAIATSPSDASKIGIKYGCLTCHNVDYTIVGPAYREVAAKYKADPEATAKLEEQIQKGGSGKWGPTIMPPFPQVSAAERKILVDWILGQK